MYRFTKTVFFALILLAPVLGSAEYYNSVEYKFSCFVSGNWFPDCPKEYTREATSGKYANQQYLTCYEKGTGYSRIVLGLASCPEVKGLYSSAAAAKAAGVSSKFCVVNAAGAILNAFSSQAEAMRDAKARSDFNGASYRVLQCK